MLNESPIKLVDFKKYPFFISDITLDFKIFKAEVYVESLMLFEPKLKESINLFLHGNDINLLSISIDGRELESKEYHVSDRDLVIYRPPLSKFKLKISSKINPFTNTSLSSDIIPLILSFIYNFEQKVSPSPFAIIYGIPK